MARNKPNFSNLPVTIRRWKGFKREKIEIHYDKITVTEWGMFGKRQWGEPVSAYKGVLHQIETEVRPSGSVSGSDFWLAVIHMLQLVHSVDEKTLLLYKVTSKMGDRKAFSANEERTHKLWQDAARALNLPALSGTDYGP